MGETTSALGLIRQRLSEQGPKTDVQVMESILRISTLWRSRVLANTLVQMNGPVVQSGPFAGMHYPGVTEGAYLPRLLGVYECELHPHLSAILSEGLDTIVDVGCAEGYYAVGLARSAPGIRVLAHDTDPKARVACEKLAAANGVADRVKVGGAFSHADFAVHDQTRTLVFMDIEGGESVLLDPEAAPALRSLKIVVETHGGEALCAKLTERFQDSHEVIRVDQGPKPNPEPQWLRGLSHLDLLLCGWEWRLGPTPWLVMRPTGPSAWR